jgi:hypothetical protein
MLMRKSQFFGLLFLLIAMPFWVTRAIWVLRSRKVQGVMGFAGLGFAGDQVKEDYSVIGFPVLKRAGAASGAAGEGGPCCDTIWFNGLGNLSYKPGQAVPVRYQPKNVYDARVDIFVGIWGDTLVYSGIPVLMLLAVFLHRKVVPWGSKLRLLAKPPYIRVLPPVLPITKNGNHG